MPEDIRKNTANVRSFRVTDDVMSRFKDIQDEMGLTHDGALKMLVDAYELDQAKNAIPDRETEINNFQTKVNELVEAFIFSLQLNQDAEARIRAEIALQMQTKDKSIAHYQEQLKMAQNSLNEYAGIEQQLLDTQIAKAGVEREFAAFKEAQDLVSNQHTKQLADKESIVSMLTDKLSAAEQKADGYDELREKYKESIEVQKSLKQEMSNMQRDFEISSERAQNEFNQIIKDLQHEHELNIERTLRASEKAQEEAIREIKDKCSEEIKKAQNSLLEATKEAQKTEREQAHEIRNLEHKISELQQELASLKK